MSTTFGKRFYINVGKGGTFRPSGNQEFDTTSTDIDDLFEDLVRDERKKILLYFHGGLVSASNGMLTAERIFNYTINKSTHYPVAFVWETGLVETISQNFDTIAKSEFFKRLLPKIIKVAAKQLGLDIPLIDGAKGIANLTDAELQQQLSSDDPFADYEVNVGKRGFLPVAGLNENATEIQVKNLIENDVQAELEEAIFRDNKLLEIAEAPKPKEEEALMAEDLGEEAPDGIKSRGLISGVKLIKAAVTITIKIVARFIKKRDHGFYPTLVEEILREFYVADLGTWVWGRMKNKAKMMWTEDDFSSTDSLDWHAGTYFLKKLEAYGKEHGPLDVDLIAHSAGAEAVCQLIDAVVVRQIGITFCNVIFMAPAVRCEVFNKKFIGNLKKSENLVKHFRCFTMSDEYEIKDHLVKGVYTRSLLYLISGILEEKSNDAYILGLQRHIAGEKPYDQDEDLISVRQFLEPKNTVVYSVTAADATDGLRSSAARHGDFDNDQEPTLDSIIYLINQQ